MQLAPYSEFDESPTHLPDGLVLHEEPWSTYMPGFPMAEDQYLRTRFHGTVCRPLPARVAGDPVRSLLDLRRVSTYKPDHSVWHMLNNLPSGSLLFSFGFLDSHRRKLRFASILVFLHVHLCRLLFLLFGLRPRARHSCSRGSQIPSFDQHHLP